MSNETIEHWARIVFGVFEAENSIIDDWRDRLLAAKNDPNDDGKTAEAYVSCGCRISQQSDGLRNITMATIKEKQDWQAQDDAYTMARYQEIMADKGRANRAIKAARQQATAMQKQADAMKNAAEGSLQRDKFIHKKK